MKQSLFNILVGLSIGILWTLGIIYYIGLLSKWLGFTHIYFVDLLLL